ncbi:hypothetical protein NPIL_287861 [Nephila pilipes]|uniref:Uncharacterized protein n=1 Tax=Nephila pilipes TaxID=299642 RepID=A0A8X6Q665_NEPPI|nr:hypothetical protein NPIL_287861 [Nephila pilipes]
MITTWPQMDRSRTGKVPSEGRNSPCRKESGSFTRTDDALTCPESLFHVKPGDAQLRFGLANPPHLFSDRLVGGNATRLSSGDSGFVEGRVLMSVHGTSSRHPGQPGQRTIIQKGCGSKQSGLLEGLIILGQRL